MSLSCHGFFIKDDYMSTLKFQREIGDRVDTFDRNLIIIDREIRPKIAHKKWETI